ncbi:MAG TPA: 3',5'-cyclic-nucleotide phosphodiesterase [Blastocatellia bacterium]|nr:3',5'-cyclic-nucleotide phosphodiesterase [Blastocatellia bacterium]
MRIRLLPSIAGRESQFQCLTSFLIDERVAVDGGSIGFALSPDQMRSVGDIVITHSHNDHIASLPIFVAEAFTTIDHPITVYGTEEVIAALREFIFNDKVWPNFEKISLMDGSGPTIRFRVLEPRRPMKIAGMNVTAVPVNHIVPTVGLIVEQDGVAVAFTSDTYVTDELWEFARAADNLKAVFVDVSFPNEMGQLAASSKHLTPQLLAGEISKLDRQAEIIAVHIKPSNRDTVIQQLESLGNPSVSVGRIDHEYVW